MRDLSGMRPRVVESGVSTSAVEQLVSAMPSNELNDGDTVTVTSELPPWFPTADRAIGAQGENIRLVDGDHDIDCKIDGFGAMRS